MSFLTLLVESNTKIESFYTLNLKTWLGLETFTVPSADAAIKYLEVNRGKVNLVIIKSHIEKESTAKNIIDYLKSKESSLPLIIIGPWQDFKPYPQAPNSLDIKLIIKMAASALNITAKEMMNKVVPDFFPIPIQYFSVLKYSVCSVYQQSSPQKHDLLLAPEKEFEQEFINTLVKNGVETLYIDKMDRLDFVHNVTSELISRLKTEELTDDEQVSAVDKSMELLSRKLLSMGVKEDTIQLAQKNMEAIRLNVKKNPKLSKLIERLLSNKTSYLFKHTQILTYIALHIVRNIDWGTPEQEEKISFIAFFHDIVLETDDQAKIKSMAEMKKADLTPEARLLVERHAQMSAEFVTKFPHSPMGADQIIRQHHGQLNGIGFSEHFGANISPISIVFIVAEEFTRIIMKSENGPFNRNEMLRELKESFPTSRFSKVLEKLQSITF